LIEGIEEIEGIEGIEGFEGFERLKSLKSWFKNNQDLLKNSITMIRFCP